MENSSCLICYWRKFPYLFFILTFIFTTNSLSDITGPLLSCFLLILILTVHPPPFSLLSLVIKLQPVSSQVLYSISLFLFFWLAKTAMETLSMHFLKYSENHTTRQIHGHQLEMDPQCCWNTLFCFWTPSPFVHISAFKYPLLPLCLYSHFFFTYIYSKISNFVLL